METACIYKISGATPQEFALLELGKYECSEHDNPTSTCATETKKKRVQRTGLIQNEMRLLNINYTWQ